MTTTERADLHAKLKRELQDDLDVFAEEAARMSTTTPAETARRLVHRAAELLARTDELAEFLAMKPTPDDLDDIPADLDDAAPIPGTYRHHLTSFERAGASTTAPATMPGPTAVPCGPGSKTLFADERRAKSD